jgi:hypothetical protein
MRMKHVVSALAVGAVMGIASSQTKAQVVGGYASVGTPGVVGAPVVPVAPMAGAPVVPFAPGYRMVRRPWVGPVRYGYGARAFRPRFWGPRYGYRGYGWRRRWW